MRTIRMLMIPTAAVLFSGALLVLPGCGMGEEPPPINLGAESGQSETRAREEYAKTQKKETVRRTSGRGSDPRG